MRLAFLGTPTFAVPTLEALVSAGHEVALVVSQPDRPAGRGNVLTRPPVAQRAVELGLPLAQPKALRAGPFPERWVALGLDVAVVVAYGRILPDPLLAAPRFGCINVHASLLPRWRGAAPIQRAVLAGDTTTGVCTQQMEPTLDTGPLYCHRSIDLAARETSGSLHDRLMLLAAEVAVETLTLLGHREPVPQATDGVTWADKIEKDDGRVDLGGDCLAIDRQVRGMSPWPGGWLASTDGPLKLGEVEPVPEISGPVGTVLSLDPLVVACGVGALRLVRVQLPGRKMVTGAEAARGLRRAVGDPLVNPPVGSWGP